MKTHAILAALVLAAPAASDARGPRVIISGGIYPGYYGYGPYYHPYGYYAPRPVYRAERYYDEDASFDADVQRALKRRGYYHGPIDGDIGPGSQSAIREYQADHGLRVTGRMDGSLIRSLGL